VDVWSNSLGWEGRQGQENTCRFRVEIGKQQKEQNLKVSVKYSVKSDCLEVPNTIGYLAAKLCLDTLESTPTYPVV